MINPSHASVKVMRSHDYCHFEVVLGFDQLATLEEVDALRKSAARLADKAVEQYKKAKSAAEYRGNISDEYDLRRALEIPEGERSPRQKAIVKYHNDAAFRARFDYDYEDEWSQPEDE